MDERAQEQQMTASLHPRITSFQSNLLRGLWSTRGGILPPLFAGGSSRPPEKRRRSSVISDNNALNPLNRLLLGLSINDMLSSARFVFFHLAFYPMEEPSGACTANGSLAVFGFAGPYYNAALSFYYLLTIRHSVREERIAAVYEPAFHGVAILYATITALGGLPLQVYNPSADGLGCFVGVHPPKCSTSTVEVECERGQAAGWCSMIAAVTPLLSVLHTLIVNNLLLCSSLSKGLTAQSDHLLDCPFDIQDYEPTESPSQSPTTSPVDAPPPEEGGPCETVEADKDNGVFGIEDETCKDGGLGCFTEHDDGETFFCRHCKAFDTPDSDHLLECAGYNPGPSDPVVCETSEGDEALGKYAFYDPTCVNGGLGCLPGGYCRLCKEFETQQSAPFVDCP